MLIKKENSIKIKNSENCVVFEYPLNVDNFSFATSEINGRYPDEKMSVNLSCEQVYYVISGKGVVHSEKGDFEIQKGDLYFFEKGEKYWVSANSLNVCVFNIPKWVFEQYKNVE